MCWSEPDDGNCLMCENIFAECEHETTYLNSKGFLMCVYCEKKLWTSEYDEKE